MTSHGPYGFITLVLRLSKPATGSRAIARTNPSFASIRSHEYAIRSAVSSL